MKKLINYFYTQIEEDKTLVKKNVIAQVKEAVQSGVFTTNLIICFFIYPFFLIVPLPHLLVFE